MIIWPLHYKIFCNLPIPRKLSMHGKQAQSLLQPFLQRPIETSPLLLGQRVRKTELVSNPPKNVAGDVLREGVPLLALLDGCIPMSNTGRGDEAGPTGRKVDNELEVLQDHVPTQLVVEPTHRRHCAPHFDVVVVVVVAVAARRRAQVDRCARVDGIPEVRSKGRVGFVKPIDVILAILEEFGMVVPEAGYANEKRE